MQFAWDAAAFLATLIAGIFTLTRRTMLSRHLERWHAAPWPVQAVLAAQAAFFGYIAVTIARGEHVSQRETIAYVISAVASVVLVVNLEWTGRTRR